MGAFPELQSGRRATWKEKGILTSRLALSPGSCRCQPNLFGRHSLGCCYDQRERMARPNIRESVRKFRWETDRRNECLRDGSEYPRLVTCQDSTPNRDDTGYPCRL